MSDIKNSARTFIVAMDYDDTFTSCPETWSDVIGVLQKAGAEVVCVTFRDKTTPVSNFPGRVYYTGGMAKWKFMHQQGVEVRIWIDDQPALIGENPYRELILPFLET